MIATVPYQIRTCGGRKSRRCVSGALRLGRETLTRGIGVSERLLACWPPSTSGEWKRWGCWRYPVSFVVVSVSLGRQCKREAGSYCLATNLIVRCLFVCGLLVCPWFVCVLCVLCVVCCVLCVLCFVCVWYHLVHFVRVCHLLLVTVGSDHDGPASTGPPRQSAAQPAGRCVTRSASEPVGRGSGVCLLLRGGVFASDFAAKRVGRWWQLVYVYDFGCIETTSHAMPFPPMRMRINAISPMRMRINAIPPCVCVSTPFPPCACVSTWIEIRQLRSLTALNVSGNQLQTLPKGALAGDRASGRRLRGSVTYP